jgi:hypothetical protein
MSGAAVTAATSAPAPAAPPVAGAAVTAAAPAPAPAAAPVPEAETEADVSGGGGATALLDGYTVMSVDPSDQGVGHVEEMDGHTATAAEAAAAAAAAAAGEEDVYTMSK